MLFWKKEKSAKIKNDLVSVMKNIEKLEHIESRKKKAIKTISRIRESVDDAIREIRERAEELKSSPYIDAGFDSDIENMGEEEINRLFEFSSRLKEYEAKVSGLTGNIELEQILMDMEKAGRDIIKREEKNRQKVKEFERMTLSQRLRAGSDEPPEGKTSDKVQFAKIAKVGRQLGGHVEQNGLVFPGASRIVKFSPKQDSVEIARQLRSQLVHLPERKKPNVSQLRKAFKAGNIRHAA